MTLDQQKCNLIYALFQEGEISDQHKCSDEDKGDSKVNVVVLMFVVFYLYFTHHRSNCSCSVTTPTNRKVKDKHSVTDKDESTTAIPWIQCVIKIPKSC